ncbi:MAG: hypothetical protein F6K00_28015 [Leptolyngbya sp. SIOISBB]|nr:hypothetical protein [Leptolyngbya sp. SIOISBB]
MTFFQQVAQSFHMTNAVWERHANPWSVWTRYAGLPLLILAIWSRVWLGWWAIAPVLLIILWIWLNPRAFSKPQTTHHWASKAVMGERAWLNHDQVPIPSHHRPVITFTNLVNAIGFVICLWGLWNLQPWPTGLGLSWMILGKTWFLDRMVWVFEDMKEHPQYRDWLY